MERWANRLREILAGEQESNVVQMAVAAMTIGKKLQDEADRLQKKRERERVKKARQRERKKANAVYEEITLRIYDPEAMKAIIAEPCGQRSDWPLAPKLGLDMAVEKWLHLLCRVWRPGELYTLREMLDKGPEGFAKWASHGSARQGRAGQEGRLAEKEAPGGGLKMSPPVSPLPMENQLKCAILSGRTPTLPHRVEGGKL